MRSLRVSVFMFLVASTLCAPSRLLAWGALGHEIQAEAAVALMQSPLKTLMTPNTDALKRMVNVPDRNWKSGAGANDERPAHFFHMDFYQLSEIADELPLPLQNALDALRASVLHENGTALWRIAQVQGQLVNALHGGKWQEVIQMAGILGHYVGDLSQPMHVTSDYDGQSIGRPGIHKYFETDLLRREDRATLLAAVLKRASELAQGTLRVADATPILDMTYEESKVALQDLQPILRVFEEDDGSEAARLLPMAVDGLARGALNLARAWDLAYAQTNAESFPETSVSVKNPSWLPFRIRDGQPAPFEKSAHPTWNH